MAVAPLILPQTSLKQLITLIDIYLLTYDVAPIQSKIVISKPNYIIALFNFLTEKEKLELVSIYQEFEWLVTYTDNDLTFNKLITGVR